MPGTAFWSEELDEAIKERDSWRHQSQVLERELQRLRADNVRLAAASAASAADTAPAAQLVRS